MKTFGTVLVFSLFAGPAFANGTVVPEIDTLSGFAALAAVGGAVTLLWERRKKK